MPIRVLSWNIKGFVSCVGAGGGNRQTVIVQVMNTFDLIFIYEVPNSVNGMNELVNLRNLLNGLGARHYAGYSIPTGGQGNEDDRIAVLYETNTVTVADVTVARCPTGLDGRTPAYFNVNQAGGVVREFCAWHAPQPNNASQLIAQTWQSILHNTMDQNRNNVTSVVLGDFNNGNLTISRRGAGRQLARQTNSNVPTTLQAANTQSLPTARDYRTSNSYDQIWTDASLLTAIGAVGVYDVMDKLVNNIAPFTGLFGTQYNTARKAYDFYNITLSDHLPVAIVLTL